MAGSANPGEPVIKQESDPVELTGFKPSEVIELISDDEDEAVIISKSSAPKASPSGPKSGNTEKHHPTTNIPTMAENTGNNKPAPRTTEEILAMQKKIADRFRTQHPAKAPPPAPTTVIDDIEARYAAAKARYLKNKAKNEVDIAAEIEFMKLEGEYSSYMRKKQADDEFDQMESADDEGLFVDQDFTAPPLNPNESSDEDEVAASPPKKRGRKRGSTTAPAQTAPKRKRTGGKKDNRVPGHDYSNNDVEEILERARVKAKSGVTKRTKPAGAGAAKGRGKKQNESRITNIASVLGTDGESLWIDKIYVMLTSLQSSGMPQRLQISPTSQISPTRLVGLMP
jgi:hypothetical protein